MPPGFWDALIKNMQLNPCEAQVFDGLLRGMTCKEIAPALCRAFTTTQTHVNGVYLTRPGQFRLSIRAISVSSTTATGESRPDHPKSAQAVRFRL